MNSNDPLPSMAPGIGWFRFWLPLLVLLVCSNLLCSNVWSAPQDIDFNNCPTLVPANIASFAVKVGTTANCAAGACNISAVPPPTQLTWTFANDAADGGCEVATPPNLKCAGISVTVPTGVVSGTTPVQMTDTTPLNTLGAS